MNVKDLREVLRNFRDDDVAAVLDWEGDVREVVFVQKADAMFMEAGASVGLGPVERPAAVILGFLPKKGPE